jgi:hypothetical protein
MIEYMGVKSLLDVGCGKGVSTSWFDAHGVDVTCVEGSHDAVTKNILPNKATQVVEHDFSRGAWWPPKTVDAVWCVEFTEHVGRNFQPNYIAAFKKAALVFVTHSNWGGWHHVEVHENEWWRTKFELNGLVYSEDLTKMVRAAAKDEKNEEVEAFASKPGQNFNAQHVWTSMQVFINPAVASMPQHAHLLAEDGCHRGNEDGKILHMPCGFKADGVTKTADTPMVPEFLPLKLTPAMDENWARLVEASFDKE